MRQIAWLLAAGLLGASLQGCSMLSGPSQPDTPASTPIATPAEPQPVAEIQYAEFDTETLYLLIAADIAVQRGRFDVTLVNYVEAAKLSRDQGVIRRAMHIAQSLNADNAQRQLASLWLDVNPDSLEAHRISAIQHIKRRQYEDALEHMEYLLSQGEDADFDNLAALAAGLPQDDQAELLKLYHDLQDRHPGNREIRYGKALLQKNTGDVPGALATLSPLLDLRPHYQPALVLYGDLLYRSGDREGAITHLRQYARRYPENRQLGTLYGRALIDDGQLQAAQDQFERLMRRFPEHPSLKLSFALVALENGELALAERHLQELADNNHHINESNFYLGQIAENAERQEDAIVHYRLVSGGGHYLPAVARVARLQAELGQLGDAIMELRELRQLHPDDARSFWLIEVNLLAEQEQHADALGAASEALQQYPDDINLLYARAMAFDRFERTDEAEADLRAILNQEPDNSVALNALGYILTIRTERLDEALTLIERAHELDPYNPAILDSVGWVHFRLGNLDKALQYLQAAYEAYPDPEIAAHYGEALWTAGQLEQARVIWRRSLREHPDNRHVLETVRRLGEESVL